uniref:LR3 n=1 Tax=Griffithsia pacifica TaxID=35689 RepID=A0A291FEB3_GRIPA|nr:LR3 [Griffithsia pacifica]5Y6P_dy Chain dy, LR3 [Griffithsia pacifica]5Y6P_dz Chain dz, LR3 [Griffithsia pacifica]
MYAFVNTTGVSATRASIPHSGLQTICGAPSRPAPATRSVSKAVIKMTGDYGITLDTLLYHPTPTISGVEDKDLICYSVWKQVFGNAYVMESERADAYVPESMFRAGQIPLREFVRGVALSATYRRRFFECCGPYRAVELNFRHLLGRAPVSQKEVSEHIKLIAAKGFEAEINSYIDSEEYEEAFGDDLVPYMRFKGTYTTCEEFNRMCTMYSAPGTTDKSLSIRARTQGIENPNHVLSLDGAGVPSKLVSIIAMGSHSSFVPVKRALPSRPDLEFGQSTKAPAQVNENANPVSRVEVCMGSYMYLTAEEAAQYNTDVMEQDQIASYAETEISEAETEIARLQAKIAELNLIK